MQVRSAVRAIATFVTLVFSVGVAPGDAADAPAQSASDIAYQGFASRGELIPVNDPLYVPIAELAGRIAPATAKDLATPPRFVLVRGSSPDAYALDGGDIFVTDSLIRFVENREELAGILCHETAHLIAGDAENAGSQTLKTATIIGAVGAVLGANRTLIGIGGENAAMAVTSARYSRERELAADARGAALCATAGANPWGLVWLFQKFERSDAGDKLEILADHPSEQARIEALEDLFRADPETYARFPIDVNAATPVFRT